MKIFFAFCLLTTALPPVATLAGQGDTTVRDAVPVAIHPVARRSPLGQLPSAPPASDSLASEAELRSMAPVSFRTANTTLREALRNVSQAWHVGILLDRRVDPEQIISVELQALPVPRAIAQIAAAAGCDATLLGAVGYIGPRETAAALRTTSALRTAEAQRLPDRRKKLFLASRPLSWPALTEPADLLQQLGNEAGVKLQGLDQVPHDLLGAVDLPSMPWFDRLTLLAAQFGLTFEFADRGAAVKLIPWENGARIERSYPAGRDAQATIARWKSQAPSAEIRLAAGRIQVVGTVEDHEVLSPAKPLAPPRSAGTQVYTLQMERVPLASFLKQLAEQADLDIELEAESLAAANIKPDRELHVDVQNATLDELLHDALDPLGLEFTRRDKSVTVRAKSP